MKTKQLKYCKPSLFTRQYPKRCKTCIIESHGTVHKDSKNKIGKVKARCARCQHPVCKKHSNNICELCRQ